jgi:DNA-binding NarL/FixJ family response regulator
MTRSAVSVIPGLGETAPITTTTRPPLAAVRAPAHDPSYTAETGVCVEFLAVDSRPLLRSGLAGIARRAFGTGSLPFADLQQAAAATRFVDGEPRALLLGLRSGDRPAELLERARRIAPTVILVFDRSDLDLSRAALDAGADGYMLVEATTVEELRMTVEAAEAGGPAIPAELELEASGRTELGISERCREVLSALAEGLRDDEIAARLGVTTSSVRKHIANAQQRLQARTRTQAVALAAREGLV